MANNLSDIDNREVDIAIRTCKEPPEKLIGRKVAEITFVAVASQDYLDATGLTCFPENTTDHKFILLDDSYSATPFYRWLDERITHKNNITTANNFLCAAALAKQDLGITVIPDYMLENETGLIKLKTDCEISRNDLWVLAHADTRNTKRVRAACQFLYQALSKKLNYQH